MKKSALLMLAAICSVCGAWAAGIADWKGKKNVQPEESYPNHLGNYVEEYVEAIREAADIWSVPLIDLYRESGLLPANASYAKFFRDGGLQGKDSLHPDSGGHRRMAKVIAAKLAALPPDFKDCK